MSIGSETHLLPGGRVMAVCGPMRLVISAFLGQVPQPAEAQRAAREAFGFLARVAACRRELSRPARESVDAGEPLAREMIDAARAVGDPDLTPMAAVAGTLADAVADVLFDRSMTRVIVNNGGDIAVRLREGESARVGLQLDVNRPQWGHVLTVNSEQCSWGICTSGLGGRSLTRGVASAAVVIADRACRADAAATSVANATYGDHPAVVRRLAGEIDPESDIAGLMVTERVASLPEDFIISALDRGMTRVGDLERAGVIRGALIAVQGRLAMTEYVSMHMETTSSAAIEDGAVSREKEY